VGVLPTLGGKRPRDGPHATIKYMLVKYTGLIKILVKTKCAPILVLIFDVFGEIMCFIAVRLNKLNLFHLSLIHFIVFQALWAHSDENLPRYTLITTHHIFRMNFRIPAVSISEKPLIGHFLKGVMFWYYYLIDQTIRKNHETYDDRGGAAKLQLSKSAPGLLGSISISSSHSLNV